MFRHIALCFLLAVSLGLTHTSTPAKSSPKTDASVILKAARNEASDTHKKVLVIFHASWCSWCHKLDRFLANDDISQIMSRNFVIVHLDVMERGGADSLENPGALSFLDSLGGHAQGLPFMAVISPIGEKLATSVRPTIGTPAGENIGFPGTQDEIQHFLGMLSATASRLTQSDIATIEAKLEARSPKD